MIFAIIVMLPGKKISLIFETEDCKTEIGFHHHALLLDNKLNNREILEEGEQNLVLLWILPKSVCGHKPNTNLYSSRH